tara:strand:+ start:687 stop:1319 length:633 start_codon:yes stop_codon:yes gene_type:complete
MITIAKLSEQISRIYARYIDKENPNTIVDKREIKLLVVDAIHTILGAKLAAQSAKGFVDIPEALIATYTNISVDNASSVYTCTLPAQPIAASGDMGIYEVFSDELNPFIPIPKQILKVSQGTDLAVLESKVGYFRSANNKIRFTADPTVSTVTMRLIINDISKYSDTDILPLPADYNLQVIELVLKTLGLGVGAIQEFNVEQAQEQNDAN